MTDSSPNSIHSTSLLFLHLFLFWPSLTSKCFGLASGRFVSSNDTNDNIAKLPRMTTTTVSSVQSRLQYVDPSSGVSHVGRGTTGDDSGEIQAIHWKPEIVWIQNVRHRSDLPSLHREGFELVKSPGFDPSFSPPPLPSPPLDFLDGKDIFQRYYSHCEALVKMRLSARTNEGDKIVSPTLVRAFDHNIRIAGTVCQADPEPTLKNSGESKIQRPLHVVHGDYTNVSAPRRLKYLSQPPKANDVWRNEYPQGLLDQGLVQQALEGKRRFAFINVWRSIDTLHPVESFPLACCDATTVSLNSDLRTLQIHYTDRIGENYLATYNPQHTWMYWDQMTHDEALLIKQWDSDGGTTAIGENDNNNSSNGIISTFSLHSAFDLNFQTESLSLSQPQEIVMPVTEPSKKNPAQRKSVEVRCVVIY